MRRNIVCRLILLEGHRRLLFICALTAILIFGLIYSVWLEDRFRFADERQYYSIAKQIVERRAFSFEEGGPTAFRPPGYPVLISIILALKGGIFAVRMINFIALSLSAWLLSKILRTHGFQRASVWVVYLVFCYPVLMYAAGTIYPQTLGGTLLLSAIYLLSGNTMFSFLGAGLVYGLLILTIPFFLLPLPIIASWPIFLKLNRRRVLRASLFLMVSMGIVSLWIVRNYVVFHRFVPVSTNSGINLLIGNSKNTTPNAGTNVDLSEHYKFVEKMDEVERDRFFRSQALRWIMDNKVTAIKLYFAKFLNYFNWRNELKTQSESSRVRDLVMFLTYYQLVLLVAIRFLFLRHCHLSRLEIFFLVLYMSGAFFGAFFFTRIRFRIPFDMILIALAAIGLERSLRFLKQKKWMASAFSP